MANTESTGVSCFHKRVDPLMYVLGLAEMSDRHIRNPSLYKICVIEALHVYVMRYNHFVFKVCRASPPFIKAKKNGAIKITCCTQSKHPTSNIFMIRAK